MPIITIDDQEIEFTPGMTILEAARKHGGEIVPPAMCYYSKLKTSGGYCRSCIVKIEAESSKNPRSAPKPVASCRTMAQEGMIVKNITSPEILKARSQVVEFLLINHPLDCPVCDQAGECNLQDLAFEHGKAETRYEFPRRTFEMHDIGDKIKLHMNRCILCYRCVKVADQLTEERNHGVMNRGDVAEISTYISKAIDNDFSGNMIDVCPVGALTDRTFRFKSRVWFTRPMDAHRSCTKCSGQVRLWYQGDEILRVTARKDQYGEVVDWICNECRYDKKKTSDWTIEGPAAINAHSVMSTNHYLSDLKTTLKLQQAAAAFQSEASGKKSDIPEIKNN